MRLVLPRRAATGLAIAAAVAAAAVPAVGTTAGAARAAAGTPVAGYDFSWPQCPAGVGNGLGNPLPTAGSRFAVVGLTDGVGLHENPCLAHEWAYARAHASYVTGYTMLTYPTRHERGAARRGHYGRCRSLGCRLRNDGWAQGAFADASLRRIGARPAMVWVDVEPRPQQPWSGNRAANARVVRAVVAALQARGYRVGIYSNTYFWHSIAGYRTALPEWVPAGSTTAGCGLAFSTGRVLHSQWGHYHPRLHAGYDENGVCAAAPALSRLYQPAHPVVTTGRAHRSRHALLRYPAARPADLGAAVGSRPAVARAATVDGPVPLVVAVAPDHSLIGRTLAGRWQTLGAAYCSGTPGVVVDVRSGWVGCRSHRGALAVTRLRLGPHGTPRAVATTLHPARMSGSPSLRLDGGRLVATARFTDGVVYRRTLPQDVSAAADTVWLPAPTSAPVAPVRVRLR